MPESTKPDYQVLFNEDSEDFFKSTKEPIEPEHIDRRVDMIIDGGADVFITSANDQKAYFPNNVVETHWDGYVEGNLSWFGSVPSEQIPSRQHWVRQMARLAEQKCDLLERVTQRCRKRGVASGISVRMNDVHDVPWPDSHLFSSFYKENPQFRLEHIEVRDWPTDGLDYDYPEVRKYYLSFVKELVDRYDFDVLELDFSRSAFYFNRGDAEQHCQTMNHFLSQVRELLGTTDHSVYLIPRIATNPTAAYQLGFDVQMWAREGLVDGITATASLSSCWDMPIDRFRDLVGPGIAIYAGADVAADRRDGLPVRYLPNSHEMLRGFAAGYLAAGADGVEVFNYCLAQGHQPITPEQFYGGLAEMRSLENIRSKPRIHVLDAGYWLVEFDLPEQVPVRIRMNKARRFEMLLAAGPEASKASIWVFYDGQNRREDLWLKVNYHDAGHAVEIRPGPEGNNKDAPNRWIARNRTSKIGVFNIPANTIRDGKNELVVRSENVSVTILGIDIRVNCHDETSGNC